MAKTISIITVTKDDPKGFQATGDSIVAQMPETSLDRVEWLVINGSTKSDETKNVIAQFSDLVTWSQSQPDGGIFHAMNEGMDKAKGDYLWFMNGGDTFETPYALASVLSAIDKHKQPDFLFGDFYHADQLRRAKPFHYNNKRMITTHQAMVFRKDVADDQRYNLQLKTASDYEFSINYLKKCHNAVYIPQPLARFAGGGFSDQHQLRGIKDFYTIRRDSGRVGFLENAWLSAVSYGGYFLRHNWPKAHLYMRNLYDMAQPQAKQEKQEKPIFSTSTIIGVSRLDHHS